MRSDSYSHTVIRVISLLQKFIGLLNFPLSKGRLHPQRDLPVRTMASCQCGERTHRHNTKLIRLAKGFYLIGFQEKLVGLPSRSVEDFLLLTFTLLVQETKVVPTIRT